MWADHAIWWQIYPLGFTGAEKNARTTVVHRLTRLENWLDYVVELGCSGLLLGPVFASETHGYDTVDHFRIDPRLGDDADFDRLVSQAHERGDVGCGVRQRVEAVREDADGAAGVAEAHLGHSHEKV